MIRKAPVDARRVLAAYGRVHVSSAGFLYAGQFEDATSQRPSAVIYLALTSEVFDVHTGTGQHVTGGAMLLGSGVRKRVRSPRGMLASIDVTPTHRLFPALARGAVTPQVWPRHHFAAMQDKLLAFREGALDVLAAEGLYQDLLRLASELVPAVPPLDARVRDVMKMLQEQRGMSTEELAGSVNLSKDWLVHLFQREVGLPLRRYEQALKVQAAAAYLQRGVSLTEVAAAAGFSDSAHFSRMWKQHYGFPPQRSFTGDELFVDPSPWPPCTQRPADSAG